MGKESLKRRFINEVYGSDNKQYLRERKADYCKVQYNWSCWIDSLCKAGEISERQYYTATFQKVRAMKGEKNENWFVGWKMWSLPTD